MKVTTSKSANSESFYISQSYINNEGKSTSKVIKKLGTLEELSQMLGTDRDGVYAWAKEQAKLETEKYKKIARKKRYSSPSMPIVNSIMVNRNSSKVDICSYSVFTTNSALMLYAEKSNLGTCMNTILMQSSRI